MGEFAQRLNHGQRRGLRFRRVAGTKHQFEMACERNIKPLLKEISCDELREVYSEFMVALPHLLGVGYSDSYLRARYSGGAKAGRTPARVTKQNLSDGFRFGFRELYGQGLQS